MQRTHCTRRRCRRLPRPSHPCLRLCPDCLSSEAHPDDVDALTTLLGANSCHGRRPQVSQTFLAGVRQLTDARTGTHTLWKPQQTNTCTHAQTRARTHTARTEALTTCVDRVHTAPSCARTCYQSRTPARTRAHTHSPDIHATQMALPSSSSSLPLAATAAVEPPARPPYLFREAQAARPPDWMQAADFCRRVSPRSPTKSVVRDLDPRATSV